MTKNKIKILALLIFAVAAAAFTFACSDESPKPAANSAWMTDKKIYRSSGLIKKIDIEKGEMTLDHDDIPGYMSAMEMTEPVADKSILENAKVGDLVDFEIERTGAKIVITKISKTGEVAIFDGREIYQTNCATCHGADGEGEKKGISLIKGHALHHTETEYIERINNGKGKKMPAFRDKLSPAQIAEVVKFIRSDLQKNVQPEASHKH